MERYAVNVTATVMVEVDKSELSEDEDYHSLVFRALEENHPDLRNPHIIDIVWAGRGEQ